MKAQVVSIDAGAHRARVVAKRDKLIVDHLGMVEQIAYGVARAMPEQHYDLEDLIAAGNVALVACAARYRPGAHDGTPFSAFSRRRIRGAMLDNVRANWCDGTHRHGLRPVLIHIDTILDAPGVRGVRGRLSATPIVIDAIGKRQEFERVSRAISWLTADQRRVLELSFSAAEPTLGEIAEIMGLVRREVAELRSSAIGELKRRLRRAA
jgi:RNA polymerase sigma factor (sigma-70 family)